MLKNKITIISALSGILAALLAGLYIQMKETEILRGAEIKKVMVAAADIHPQTLIEPGLLKIAEIPKMFVQPGAVTDYREAKGRVTTAEIKIGEQLLKTKLVSAGAKTGISQKVTTGMRGVSIELEKSRCAGGLVRPDDYVDVVVTMEPSRQSEKYTYILFQNIEVLAVDSEATSFRDPSGAVHIEKEEEGLLNRLSGASYADNKSKIITLALKPEDARRMIFAKEAGKINLIVRSETDSAITDVHGTVSLKDMAGGAGMNSRDYKEYRGGK